MAKGSSSKTTSGTAKKGSTGEHQKVVKLVLLKMTSEHCRVWANNTGVGRSLNDDRIVRFGLKGSPDIIGLYKGIFLGVEVKTGNARQTKDQKNFQAMIDRVGGIYIVCQNNVEQIAELVEKQYELRRNQSKS